MSEVLNDIESLAALQEFTPKEIARVVDIDEELLNPDSNSPERKAFDKGRLMEKADHNKRVNQLSKAGSGPAQILIVRMRRDAEFERLRQFYG